MGKKKITLSELKENINLSYDYGELIKEIEEELQYGSLYLNSKVQILRNKEKKFKEIGYLPIVDWFYEHKKQMSALAPDFFDNVDDRSEKNKLLAHYELYRASLEEITVEAMLNEMKEFNYPITVSFSNVSGK